MSACRCGHDGDGPHPCHFDGYACGEPATQRFYNARPAALAGLQMKVVCDETWACDEHWTEFEAKLVAAKRLAAAVAK